MKKNIVRITTQDTKKTYDLPGDGVPQLWEVELFISAVSSSGYVRKDKYQYPSKTFYFERKTLENIGMIGAEPKEKPVRTAYLTTEDLLLELLAEIGIYPQGPT